MSMLSPSDQQEVMRRVMWRVMPLVMLAYLTAVIDRANVGFAKLQMIRDLGISEQAFGLAASLFFIGYLVFEIPSTLAVHRFGARKWISRILLSWGVVTVWMAWTTSETMFTVLRFMLGVAEAGAYPGIIFFTTLWFPQAYRVRVMGIVTLGSAFGNMFGSLLSGPLLDLDGSLGLAGWQWVFIVTGMPAVIMGLVIFFTLPDSPAEATFLSPSEKSWLADSIQRDGAAKHDHGGIWQVLWDPRVLFLSGVYTLILTSLYGVIYWLPTVVKAFGATGTQNGLLSAVPWAVTVGMLVVLPGRLKQHRTVLVGMATLSLVGVAAFFASTVVPANWMRFVALTIGTPCISLLLPCFWSLPSRFLSGARAAAGIGAISTLGNFGGFAAQNLMPWAAKLGGSAVAAMLVPTVCLAALGIGAAIAQAVAKRNAVPA
ncbi:MFS transporter [Rhodoplanes sp. TEM]|uniref:MFS transporter n=1 Tax=Rhodoplanes tepidamans TaxID=200616 RepID=A0ABT5JIV6_RHOTP|nr:MULTISPECIES: MFS transporter [Rhodoplanes]MDC7789527.1 MFS transporter [Rhodoplanes tepidamans]MDC7987723.1 MFS transporter [Rhodoplanes sp. TEM]MDQ0354009.1 sugar phosphate permease [Rhodoplanes tepidamans]